MSTRSPSTIARRGLLLFIVYSFVSLRLLRQSFQSDPGSNGVTPLVSRASRKTFLKVPFYVYNNELNWINVTLSGVPVSKSWYPTFKHSDDYWFIRSALQHPSRVSDPSKAKLFFVPLLLNAVTEAKNNATTRFCVHGKCNQELDLIEWANEKLGNSTFFQRNHGRDHVVVASHYDHPVALETKSFSNLRKCAMVSFEDFQKLCFKGLNRCLKLLKEKRPKILQVDPRFLPKVFLPSLYVGHPCRQTGKKTSDFAMVASIDAKPVRQRVCDWLSKGNFNVSICGEGNQCPALPQAKYGFHSQGDSFGSNRLMDTLLSGTIPIFTDEKQYDILPYFYPWQELSYFAPLTTFEEFSCALHSILNQPESVYNEKLGLIAKYRDFFDFSTGVPFDRYLAEFSYLLKVA